jgi:PAS domain-containing protein
MELRRDAGRLVTGLLTIAGYISVVMKLSVAPRTMKSLLLAAFSREARALDEQPSLVDLNGEPIDAMMASTRRELAMFASDLMGAQSALGQFRPAAALEPARVLRSRFRDMIESTAVPFMVIDPRAGLHLIDVNDAYAAATLVVRNRVAGEKLFDVFPDNPGMPKADGVSNLFESIRRAAQTGEPHKMAVQRYDVRDTDGAFVEKHWLPINTPIFDERGRLTYILHQAQDVTPARR